MLISGAVGNVAVAGGQFETAQIQDFEAVRASSACLKMVLLIHTFTGSLRNLHLTAVVGGIEGQLAHFFREVHSCNGAQTYRAVLYRLSR